MTTSPPVRSEPRPFAVWPTLGIVALAVGGGYLAYDLAWDVLEKIVRIPWSTLSRLSAASSVREAPNAVLYGWAFCIMIVSLPKLARRTLDELGFDFADLRKLGDLRTGAVAAMALLGFSQLYLVVIGQTHHVATGYEHFRPATLGDFIAVGLMLVVIGPVTEELLFRCLIFRALEVRMPSSLAAILSGLAFGAVHRDLVFLPDLALMGFVAARLYRRTDNLWTAIAQHATNNAVVFIGLIAHHWYA